MDEDERDAQGTAVDEWCWTDMMREDIESQNRLNAAIDAIKAGE